MDDKVPPDAEIETDGRRPKVSLRIVPWDAAAETNAVCERDIREELRMLEETARGAIETSGPAMRRMRSIRARGYTLYVVQDLVIGIYRRSEGPNATPRDQMLYGVTSYGESDDLGALRLTPSRTRRLVHGAVAREAVARQMGLARFASLACGFCGHRAITVWKRCVARYVAPAGCPACQRLYTLDTAAVRRFSALPVCATVAACCWLAGRTNSMMPLACAALSLVVAELVTLLCAPQRLR